MTNATRTNGTNGKLVFKFIFFAIINIRLQTKDKRSASHKSKKLSRNPNVNPVIKKVIPSPSPISPPVSLLTAKRTSPTAIPPNFCINILLSIPAIPIFSTAST